MKKRLLLLSLILSVLTGCDNTTKIELYSDASIARDGVIELNFTSLHEAEQYPFPRSTDFTLCLTNKSIFDAPVTLKDAYVIRESDSVKYGLNGRISVGDIYKFGLLPNVTKSIEFTTYLPTSIKDESYSFYLKYNSTELIYHLYETPDELRNKIDVTFIIDGDTTEVRKIPERRLLIDYPWISSDYVYSSDEWYYDSNYNYKISDKYQITQPITIYLRKKSILKYDATDISKYSYIYGYNFIPHNGEIVIPREYEGKPVYSINPSSFSSTCSELKTIYIPKTVRIYASDNFTQCTNLEYVYFEGTKEEWAIMNKAKFNYKAQIVFNTYK